MLNTHPWLEEQLNQERRRDIQRQAEQERAAQPERKDSAWDWLQNWVR